MPQETQLTLRSCAGALLVIATIMLGRSTIDPWLGNEHPYGLIYGGVALVVWFAGWRAAVLAAAVGLLGASFWFVQPRGTLLPRGLLTIFSLTQYAVSCTIIIAFGEGMRRARRRAELVSEQLRQSEEALREASQRKDEFLAMLAHELRNPLAPMLNALQYLRLRASDRAEFHEMRASLERQVHHMAALVDDLVDVARITRGHIHLHKENVSVAAIIESALDSTSVLFKEARHELAVSLPSTPVYVDADPRRLLQVFVNLLNNAAKFTPAGGRITVVAGIVGTQVEVRIRDNGIGIEARELRRVFDMFAQADSSLDRARGGLGIGLTLANHLVTLHGGLLEARSEGIGKGSELIVRLPHVPCVASVAAPPQELAVARQPRRILLVDDNRDAARGLSLLLNAAGHTTRVEHDGLAGVDAIADFRPDMVLLDIGLPLLNGYEAARRIRNLDAGADCVIIAMTGWGKDEDKQCAIEAGCDVHVTKPVRPLTIAALIDGAPQDLCAVIPPRLARLYASSTKSPMTPTLALASPREPAEARDQLQPAVRASFLARADHDLRRAIHGVGVLIELMRARMPAGPAHRLLDHVQASVDSVEHLMLGLVELSKIEGKTRSHRSTDVALSDLFEALRRSEEPAAQMRGLLLQVASTDAIVQSDPISLFNLLRPLISQTICHTNRGEIHLASRQHAGAIHIGIYAAGAKAMEERQGPSLELSLAIARQYAELLGHRVLETQPLDRGVQFIIEVSAARATTQAIDPPDTSFPWEAATVAAAF